MLIEQSAMSLPSPIPPLAIQLPTNIPAAPVNKLPTSKQAAYWPSWVLKKACSFDPTCRLSRLKKGLTSIQIPRRQKTVNAKTDRKAKTTMTYNAVWVSGDVEIESNL